MVTHLENYDIIQDVNKSQKSRIEVFCSGMYDSCDRKMRCSYIKTDWRNNVKKALMEMVKFKEEEYKQKKESFKKMVDNEMDNGAFEKNAINALMVMAKLRAEIAELECVVKILR